MKSGSSSSDDAPYPTGSHSGAFPQYEARSSGSVQAAKFELSDLQVLFELTPSSFHSDHAQNIDKAGTRPVANDEQIRNEVARIGPLEPFALCIGAEQEVVPVAQASAGESRLFVGETFQEEPSYRQRSHLDAMQKFVRKERSLLARALLQLPSSGQLDNKDVPNTVEEVMKLLLEDSRSFLQWTLDAKRGQLEMDDAAAKARDRVLETEAGSEVEAESESCTFGIQYAATMACDVAMSVRVALVLIVAIGLLLLSL